MIKRRENSKGQALVMVTLALLAMAGMMGLAVDLGWSFVQKQAQAAADGAALAAVQEAMAQLTSGTVSRTLGSPRLHTPRRRPVHGSGSAMPGRQEPASWLPLRESEWI